jgi:hypothetical protein
MVPGLSQVPNAVYLIFDYKPTLRRINPTVLTGNACNKKYTITIKVYFFHVMVLNQ